MKTFKIKNSIVYLLLATCCIGIFYINRYNTHDWGDDFALYLMQAGKTSEFSFQKNTFYVFNELNSMIAPSYYPPIFPVFLSLFYKLFSNTIVNYILLNHFVLLGLVLILFHYLKLHASIILSFLFALLFAYNPWILHFKNEVMSEFLFVILILAFTIQWNKKQKNNFYIILLAALLISTRSIAWIIIPAIMLDLLLKERNLKTIKQIIILCASIIAIVFLFNLIFIGELFSHDYTSNFKQSSVLSTISSNFFFYTNAFSTWFIPHLETKKILIPITQCITVGLFLFGIIKSILKKENTFEFIFLLLYLFVILIYPYQGANFRLLLPIIPFVFLFSIKSILHFTQFIPIKKAQPIVMYCIPIFFLIQYLPSINYCIKNNVKEIDGPNTLDAQQAFKAIIQYSSKKDTIYFHYPKTLAYYTQQHSKAFPEQNPSIIRFFLEDNQFPQKYADELKNSRKFDTVWNNHRFILFKKID